MSKSAQIERIVMDILKDGEWHNVSEFKEEMQRCNPELLEVSNTLSSTLYQMRTKKHLIEKDKKGVYHMLTNDNVSEERSDINVNTKMLNLWRKFYMENNPLPDPSYEMDEEEFREGKKIYELNRKIENFIKKS